MLNNSTEEESRMNDNSPTKNVSDVVEEILVNADAETTAKVGKSRSCDN